MTRIGACSALLITTLLAAVSLFGCDRAEKSGGAPPEQKPEPAAAPRAEPPSRSGPPELAIDEISPKIGFSRAILTTPEGKPHAAGLEQLRKELAEEKEHLTGRELTVLVDRKARVEWVNTYLEELKKLGAQKLVVKTDTRSDYPQSLEFVPGSSLAREKPCSLVGTITADRGTAIWRISGGTARKRGRGMGGPDLTMTAETILGMAKGCDSDLFVTSGAEGVEWGLVYDLAASALRIETLTLKRAALPEQRPTPGHALLTDR